MAEFTEQDRKMLTDLHEVLTGNGDPEKGMMHRFYVLEKLVGVAIRAAWILGAGVALAVVNTAWSIITHGGNP